MLMYSDPKKPYRLVTQQWAKRGPPFEGCPQQSCDSVTTLARAPSPRCAPFLATEPLRAITVRLSNDIGFYI
jgi:hypothetical protein